jgi:DNA-binding transcriptional regulator YhcF (GntR family)
MNFNNNKPIYIQIADYFLENIISKKYNKGDRIMSVRDIAVELGVNPNTVMRAYTYLQEKDIIFNKRGIGYFIAEKSMNNAKRIKQTEFLKDKLPDFFKTISILDFDIEIIKEMYNDYLLKMKTIENENQ